MGVEDGHESTEDEGAADVDAEGPPWDVVRVTSEQQIGAVAGAGSGGTRLQNGHGRLLVLVEPSAETAVLGELHRPYR
jgi:hypothetical protein